MANYILISHEQVAESYPQYLHTVQLPNGYHILSVSAMRFLADADVLIRSEAQIRAMRNESETTAEPSLAENGNENESGTTAEPPLAENENDNENENQNEE